MSGKNKVNPDHYKVAGRLSTDDLARARRQQAEPLFGAARSGRDKPMPPWMLNDQLERTEPGDSGNTNAAALEDSEDKQEVSTAEKPMARPRAKAKIAKSKSKTGAATASKASARPRTARKTAKSRKVTNARGSGRTPTTREAARKSARALAKKAPRRAAKRSTRTAARKSTSAAAKKSSRKARTTKRKTPR